MRLSSMLFFFFQAEDGIRDSSVTGVQTCALPILFEKGDSPAVWLFDRQTGSLSLRPVTVARYEANSVIIASGLAKGDIVITAGVNTLTVGQKVRLAEADVAQE